MDSSTGVEPCISSKPSIMYVLYFILLLREVSKNSKYGHDGYRTALSRRVIGNRMEDNGPRLFEI